MIELPVERAQKFRKLLTAARGWREKLIPGTDTSHHREVVELLAALEELDD